MKKIINNIEYSKRNNTFYIWKTLYKNDIPVAFTHLFNGTKRQCEVYAKKNKIKLDKELPI